MNFAKKIYSIVFFICLLTSTIASEDQATHTSFTPNKRHMHEKKEVKKESVPEKKSSNHAARIHKKTTEKTPQNPNEDSNKKSALQNTKVKRTTNIARHHKNYEKNIEKKETFFQKTWSAIKAFFSSKKTG